jgi:hypothetical protein
MTKKYSAEVANMRSPVNIDHIDSWLLTLHNRIKLLEDANKQLTNENIQLRSDNENKNKLISDFQVKLGKIEDSQKELSTSSRGLSFASVVSGDRKYDDNIREAEAFVAATIDRNNKEKSFKENNIIISGIKPSEKDDKDDKLNDDKERVHEVLNVLSIDVNEIKSLSRLRKNDNGQSIEINQIKVVFKSSEAKLSAFKNAKNLKSSLLNNIYINQDLTFNERTILKNLISKRNSLNSKFVNQNNESVKNGIDEKTGKSYYWGIRNNELKKIFIKC